MRWRALALLLATLALVAASCSSDSESTTTTSDDSSGATTTSSAPAEVGGEIDFLSWEGYDLPGIMTDWLDTNEVVIVPTYPGNHDDIQARLLGGGEGGYDIFTYYQGYKDLYTQLDLFEPIDESKIPNLDGLLPFFASDVGDYWFNSDGERIGVPWTWSINALTYDSSAIDEPTTYYDLLNPDYKDKIVVVDDPLGAYTIGALIFGYDVAALTQEQLTEVNDFLAQVLAQARSVAPSYGDATSLLVSGEGALVYPGWAAMSNFAAAAGKDTVTTAIPEEGGMATTDAWAIPPGADNVDAAYAWINETLDAAINAAAADYLVGGTVVADSVPLLSPENAAAYPFYGNLDAVFDNVRLFGIPPQESDEFMTYAEMVDEWTALKAGS